MSASQGWYKANYAAAACNGVTVRNSWRKGDWGYQQGCDFAKEKCLDPATLPPTVATATLGQPPHFFNAPRDQPAMVCSTDRLYYGFVAVSDTDQYSITNADRM